MSEKEQVNIIDAEDKKEPEEEFYVVKNHEEQYSIWSAEQEVPVGWSVVSGPSFKEVCLRYIEKVWIDMRPLSLRKQMQNIALDQNQ